MTMLIEEPNGGTIPLSRFFRYLIVSFVILQAWLYLTNYVNRYGQWEWWEYHVKQQLLQRQRFFHQSRCLENG